MNYEVVNNCGSFNVVETTTEQTIESFKNFSEAKKMAGNVNLGYAFDGFTPKFFLKSCKNSDNLV